MNFPLYLGNDVVFQIRAKNVIGWGVYSGTNPVIDIVRSEPLAPLTEIVEGELTDDSQIHITWFPVSDPQTGFDEILAYQVYWDNGNVGTEWVLLV